MTTPQDGAAPAPTPLESGLKVMDSVFKRIKETGLYADKESGDLVDEAWAAIRAFVVKSAAPLESPRPTTAPRPAMTHRLKCHPEPFQALLSRVKPFEWRKFDRDYRVGDALVLNEWDPELAAYTGHLLGRKVTYLISGKFGIPADYCIMGLAAPQEESRGEPAPAPATNVDSVESLVGLMAASNAEPRVHWRGLAEKFLADRGEPSREWEVFWRDAGFYVSPQWDLKNGDSAWPFKDGERVLVREVLRGESPNPPKGPGSLPKHLQKCPVCQAISPAGAYHNCPEEAPSPAPAYQPIMDIQAEWNRLKPQLAPEKWTATEESTYFGFFCHGWWGRRGQAAFQEAPNLRRIEASESQVFDKSASGHQNPAPMEVQAPSRAEKAALAASERKLADVKETAAHVRVLAEKYGEVQAPAPSLEMDEEIRAGLRLILRSFVYTEGGVIGPAKKWIEQVLATQEREPGMDPVHDYILKASPEDMAEIMEAAGLDPKAEAAWVEKIVQKNLNRAPKTGAGGADPSDVGYIDSAAERFPHHDWAKAWHRLKPFLVAATPSPDLDMKAEMLNLGAAYGSNLILIHDLRKAAEKALDAITTTRVAIANKEAEWPYVERLLLGVTAELAVQVTRAKDRPPSPETPPLEVKP